MDKTAELIDHSSVASVQVACSDKLKTQLCYHPFYSFFLHVRTFVMHLVVSLMKSGVICFKKQRKIKEIAFKLLTQFLIAR